MFDEEIKSYLNELKTTCPKLTDASIDYYQKELYVSLYPAKYFYIQTEILQKQIGYLLKGLIRIYYIDDKGNEVNVNFLSEGDYVVHYGATIDNVPSKYYFQCLEPSVIINAPLSHIHDTCDKFPEMNYYLRMMLELELSKKQKRIDSFVFNNAEERYLDFVNNNPDLFKRLSLSHLSSYLGIERQTLTRIRKKLMSE